MAASRAAGDGSEGAGRRRAVLPPRALAGVLRSILQRFDAAAVELAAANRLDPRDADTLAHLAFCEAKLGRPAEAQAHIAAALALDPNQPLARQLTALLR